jgi:Fic family protein
MNDVTAKFNKRIQQPEPHIVGLLAFIDGIKGEFKSGLKMSPYAITNLKRSVLITSAGASTRIEGARLPDEVVADILSNFSVIKFEDRDYQEVQGYLEALSNVFEAHSKLPLREGVISSLHKELLKYSSKDEMHRGKYKQKENIVGLQQPDGTLSKILFDTSPAWRTGKEMKELVDWTADALNENHFHPLLVIANFIVEFLRIHPFEDGNGRLSRVLTNLLLLRSGYQFMQYVSHEQIIERRKDEYYVALRKSQETFGMGNRETIAPWLNFFLSVIHEQATKSLALLQEEKFEDTLSPKQLEVWKYLSGGKQTSPKEIAQATGVEITTIRKSLGQLLKSGKIRRTGRGSATKYIKLESIE